MESLEIPFIEEFGKDIAQLIIEIATSHISDEDDPLKRFFYPKTNTDYGNDYFIWCLLVCIDYECLSNERYRQIHSIPEDFTFRKLIDFCKAHKEYFEKYTGSFNETSYYCGAYDILRDDEK